MSRDGSIDEGGDQNKFFGDDRVEFSSASNKSGWIVSYADMMTIILTFMILLLSVSTIAQTKFDLLVEALTGRKVGNLHKVKEKIDQVVEKASLGGQVTTSIDEDGLKVQFSNALLFPSGKAELTDRGVDVFKPIATHLIHDLQPEYGVTIEGYTDDVPIENGEFSSNWDLSTSRAIHVMHRLAGEGFDRRRISVQGFADTRSATDVDLHDEEAREKLSKKELEEVRAKNRRVVIRINRLDEDVLKDILTERKANARGTGTDQGASDAPVLPGSKEKETKPRDPPEGPVSEEDDSNGSSGIRMFDATSRDDKTAEDD